MIRFSRIVMSAAIAEHPRAPVGGVTIRGTDYRGGEFIPKEVAETLTPDETRALEGGSGSEAQESSIDPADDPVRDTSIGDAKLQWKRRGVMSPRFKMWFGDWEKDPENASKATDASHAPQPTSSFSQVVDVYGQPQVVYHGTTHDFESFSMDRATRYSNLGPGFYFSSSDYDSGENYAGEGPDLRNRIEEYAESLMTEAEAEGDWEWGDPDEDFYEEARATLHGGQNILHTMFLNIRNPVVIGKPIEGTRTARHHKETFYHLETEAEDPPYEWGTDEYDEWENSADYDDWADRRYDPEYWSGDGYKLFRAIEEISTSYYEGIEMDILGNFIREFSENEGMYAGDVYDFLVKNLGMAVDPDTGDHIAGELIGQLFQDVGHDGIIDQSVWSKFQGMDGVGHETVHYVIWDPARVKSTENRGTFDPHDNRFRFSVLRMGEFKEEEHPRDKDGQFKAKGAPDKAPDKAKGAPDKAKSPDKAPDKAKRRKYPWPDDPTPKNTESQYTVGKIAFDSVKGKGAIGFNSNINYDGFVAFMTPDEFLSLNPPRPGSEDDAKTVAFFKEFIESGGAMGPPYLSVKLNRDTKTMEVIGHEGRGRMMAAASIQPDEPIPIHITAVEKNERGTHSTVQAGEPWHGHGFTPDEAVEYSFSSDRRADKSATVRPTRWFVDGDDVYEKRLSLPDYSTIAEEIGTGTGRLAKMAESNPWVAESSRKQMRSEHGDTVTLYRALQIERGAEIEAGKTSSGSTDLHQALAISQNMPGLVMRGEKAIVYDTILVRYDVSVDDVLVDVRTLMDSIPSEYDDMEVTDSRGQEYTIKDARGVAAREKEVIATLGDPSAVVKLDSSELRSALPIFIAGEYESDEKLIKDLRKRGDYLGVDEDLRYDHQDALREAKKIRESIETLL